MYKKAKQAWAKHWDFAVWDLIVLVISYYISCVFRFGIHMMQYGQILLIQMSLVLVLVYFCVSIFERAYKNIIHRSRYQELFAVIIQVVSSYAIFTIYMYLTQDAYFFSRQVYLVSAVLSIILIYAERIIWKRIIRLRKCNRHQSPKRFLRQRRMRTCTAYLRIFSRREGWMQTWFPALHTGT